MIRLEPALYQKVWGATRLAPWLPDSDRKIGEAWFTADPPLPILLKFLFTSGKLSVQVHPDGECGTGKTEMWYILRADAGARIALGFEQPITRERAREAARTGEIERLLKWFPVKAGQCYFTPARTVHAIGPGLALCEIQQNSDITYRLYDYGRPRELHLEQGLAVAELGVHPGASAPRALENGWTELARCRWFATEMRTLTSEGLLESRADSFQLVVCIEGRGRLGVEPVATGDVWLVRAGERCTIRPEPSLRLLRAYVP